MDLTFGDRRSFCVIRASRFLDASAEAARAVAADFFSDAYWFDQAACSSPSTVYWLGPREECRAAGDRFVRELIGVIRTRGHVNETGAALEVMAHAFACAAGSVPAAVVRGGNELTVIDYGDESPDEPADDRRCGFGFFTFFTHRTLDDLAGRITRREQTMTYFGLEHAELEAFARRLNGRGVDRIVPMGKALRFERFWDGYDILHDLTKCVVVAAASRT
jgi:hypothetical protein